MTHSEHPITPPPELVEEWASDVRNAQHFATQAARWGRPELQPADSEVAELVAWLRLTADEQPHTSGQGCIRLARAADLLERLILPQPIPVSERLPGPEDCDVEGRCWLGGEMFAPADPTWVLGYPSWAERFPEVHRFWLPAHALPVPTSGGGFDG